MSCAAFCRGIRSLTLVRRKHNIPLNLIVNVDVEDDLLFQWISNRWVHLPSGRIYSTSYRPPRIPGLDDVTGEPLTRRPDDNPVRHLDFFNLCPYCDTDHPSSFLGNVCSSPRTLLRADLTTPLLLRLAGIFHASRRSIRRHGYHLAQARDPHARIFPRCPGTCSSLSTNATWTATSPVGITHPVGRPRRTLHFIDVASRQRPLSDRSTDSSHVDYFPVTLPIHSFGIHIPMDDRYTYFSTCCRSISPP